MKTINIVLLFLILLPCILFAEIVPKGDSSYFQLQSIIKDSNISELDKYIGIESGLTKEEMAEIVAKVLINNSYIDMQENETERKPVFYPLKDVLPELREITVFLKEELSEYGIDHDYIEECFEKLSRFIEREEENKVSTKDKSLAFKKKEESQKFIEREILKIRKNDPVLPKESYSPSSSFREISLYSADIPEKKWGIEGALSIHKRDSSGSDSISKTLDYIGFVYSPTSYTSTYAYYDNIDLQENGFYAKHSSFQIGMKTLINRFARNYAKFCIGLETQQYSGSYSKNKSRVYLASAFKLKNWETTQIINNMSFYKLKGENKFINSFGIENKFPFLPVYWIFELNEDFQGSYSMRDYALRIKRKHLNYDFIYEDDNRFDRQRVKINCFWTF